MQAAYCGHSDTVALLLDQGASAAATTDDGKTAKAYATEEGYADAFGAALMARLG